MTTEEFLQIVTYNIARLQATVQEFREEAYGSGYAQGWDDAKAGREFSPDLEETSEDDGDDDYNMII